MRAVLFIYFSFFILAAGNAAAAGFGVSPSSLDFRLEKGMEASRQVMIYNTGSADAEFVMASSSPETLKVWPEKVAVSAGGSVPVVVTAFGKSIGERQEEIALDVVNSNVRDGVAFSIGTVIPARLDVFREAGLSASPLLGLLVSGSIIVSGLAAYYAFPIIAKFI